MSDKAKAKVITGKAVLSFPHLAEPQKAQNPGDKEKYSCALVFLPGSDISELQAAVFSVAEAKWGSSAKDKLRTGALKSPFRMDAEAKGYPEGSMFINARSERKPGTVYLYPGPDGKTPAVIEDADIKEQLYAGSIVRASVVAFTYDKGVNKGVGFALNNIQKLGEGERLDSRVAATSEFDADLNAAPADLSAFGA